MTNIYIIAHEGKLQHAAIVRASDPQAATVKYYETARACGQKIGMKGDKCFEIANIRNHDGLPVMREMTMYHHADLDGNGWLADVEPINHWAKYGHCNYTAA